MAPNSNPRGPSGRSGGYDAPTRGSRMRYVVKQQGPAGDAVPSLALENFALHDDDSGASSGAPSARSPEEQAADGVYDVERIFEFNIDELVKLARVAAWGTSAPGPAPAQPPVYDDPEPASPGTNISAEFTQARVDELTRENRLLRKEAAAKDWSIERLRRALCELLSSTGGKAQWANAVRLAKKEEAAARKSWGGTGPAAADGGRWQEQTPNLDLLMTPERPGAAAQTPSTDAAPTPWSVGDDREQNGSGWKERAAWPGGGAGGGGAVSAPRGKPAAASAAVARLDMRKWLTGSGGKGNGSMTARGGYAGGAGRGNGRWDDSESPAAGYGHGRWADGESPAADRGHGRWAEGESPAWSPAEEERKQQAPPVSWRPKLQHSAGGSKEGEAKQGMRGRDSWGDWSYDAEAKEGARGGRDSWGKHAEW